MGKSSARIELRGNRCVKTKTRKSDKLPTSPSSPEPLCGRSVLGDRAMVLDLLTLP
jgi:hypothetical protein